MNINKKLNLIIYSLEAEQAVLGALIFDNSTWEAISKKLTKTDFYKQSHQIIFSAITTLIDNNSPVDVLILANFLNKTLKLANVGGISYLKELNKHVPNTGNIIIYTDIVKDKSILRSILNVSKDIVSYSLSNKYDLIEELIDYTEEKILAVSRKYIYRDKITEASDILTRTIRRLEKVYQINSQIMGLSSGFEELDRLTLGFNKSDLIIIAGRPSMGKTAFAMNIAEHVVVNLEKPILIFSMEMSAEQIIERMIASMSRVNLQKIRSGLINGEEWSRVMSSVALLARKKFYIYDGGPSSLFDIKRAARRVSNLDKNLSAVIVDYIQLIKISEHNYNNNRTQELADISRALKSLAVELNVPVIALSQLNRALEQRQDKRPVMADIRESGAIEQDADLILFIYRDEVYNKNSKQIGKADIIISKQRNGPTGQIKLDFFSEFVRFESINKDFHEYWV